MGRRGIQAGSAILAAMLAVAPLAAMPGGTDAGADVDAVTIFASGEASFFSSEMAGRRTASGEQCDPDSLTAAHRTLAFGTRVRVTSRDTGRSVIVRINDRGPFRAGRVIDLSHAAAREIGLAGRGRGMVDLSLAD